MKKLMMVMVAVIGAAQIWAADGRAATVGVWRGETATVWVDDGVKLGAAPEGIALRVGMPQNVMYRVGKTGNEYAYAPDRIVWTTNLVNSGRRVVEVKVDERVAAGEYAAGDLKVRVDRHVLPPPAKWRYNLDLWQHPWAVARVGKIEPFSPAHYAAMKPLWEQLAAAGQKTLMTTLIDLPWNHQCYDGYGSMIGRVRRADGSWAFDYSVFDEYVEFGRACGIGPFIACYTVCPWGYKVRWRDEAGAEQVAEARPGKPFFDEFWEPFIRDFAAHLKAKGWFEDTFIAMDERLPDDMEYIVKFIARVAPGLKISTAGDQEPEAFAKIESNFAYFSQILSKANKGFFANAEKRRAAGRITTTYVCVFEQPNTYLHSSLDEAFWLGFYPAAAGMDGFLRWAYNCWGADTMTDATYRDGWWSGAVYLVYPDGSPSARFLALQDGIRHAEKYWILEREGGHAEELKALAARYDLDAALNGPRAAFTPIAAATREVLNR